MYVCIYVCMNVCMSHNQIIRFYSKITTNNESLSEKTSWIHCIEDIQGSHLKFFNGG